MKFGFCEKCKYQGLNDPMCKCCDKDPCDKTNFNGLVNTQYNLQIPEFCKYCQYGTIQDVLCKCCKRFEKKKKIKEEVLRIKKLL